MALQPLVSARDLGEIRRLQSFCNPNPRSPMGFVGTQWEAGP